MNSEQFADELAARRYGYVLLQRLMGDRLTEEVLSAIDTQVAKESFAILGVDDTVAERFFGALESASAKLDDVYSEYMRVFVGPGALPAPPWESVYADKLQRLLMTETTLAVRKFYKKEGFESASYPHVPDDHVAIELDFMANMASCALDAFLAQEDETCKLALSASEDFLDEHLCAWVGDFAKEVEEKAEAPFYAIMAKTVEAFTSVDARFLRQHES